MANDISTLLPDEIVEYILGNDHLDFLDVVRFGLTCKHLHKIVNGSNTLWKTKFFQRWPKLEKVYQNAETINGSVQNWKEEAKASTTIRRRMLQLLSLMSSKYYEKEDLLSSDLHDFDSLGSSEENVHPLTQHFYMDELISLIEQPDMGSNLTDKYYAYKVLSHVKQSYLKGEWAKFLSLPPKQQLLEYAATIVAQWNQPQKDISYSHIAGLLDDIAEQAKKVLKNEHPGHSMFSIPEEEFVSWKLNIIDDNQWTIPETRQVMDALCKVLYTHQQLKCYAKPDNMHYTFGNYFIDYVLEQKCGTPITLAIVFESVARRLGIRCEPVIVPFHFLLRWKESYRSPEADELEDYYIDVLNEGRILTKRNCPQMSNGRRCPIEKYNAYFFLTASAEEVATRLAHNIEVTSSQCNTLNGRFARWRSALELQHMLEPDSPHLLMKLEAFYLMRKMISPDLPEKLEKWYKDSDGSVKVHACMVQQNMQTLQLELGQKKNKKQKIRVTQEPKYAVGLIMQHKTRGYTCVIAGWDLHCSGSRDLMAALYHQYLTQGTEQPFYNVLTEDGSSDYVPEEALLLSSTPCWLNHDEMGKYFSKFCGTHYLPNAEKAWEYPMDEEIRNEWLRKTLLTTLDKNHLELY